MPKRPSLCLGAAKLLFNPATVILKRRHTKIQHVEIASVLTAIWHVCTATQDSPKHEEVVRGMTP